MLFPDAIKYGCDGKSVELRVSRARTTNDDDGDDILFSVIDYGRGIHESEIESIFQPFQQAKKEKVDYSGNTSGTGLGLAITSKLVEALGGTIQVESEVGKGCNFFFTIPTRNEIMDEASSVDSISPQPDHISSMLQTDKSDRMTDEQTTTTTTCDESHINSLWRDIPTTTDQLKILIAEDNKINQKVLQRTLQRLGVINATIVEDGKQAVDLTTHEHFDYIFMDLQMPIMDGLEATKYISQRQVYPIIIFLTAHAANEFQQESKQVGGDGFITKPFKIDNIKDALDKTKYPTRKYL